MTKKLVPIDAVSVHPLNVRMARTDDNISRLANSIKRRGQEYPLKVIPNPKNPAKYLCYDGGYRLEATKIAKIGRVWIEIEDVKNEAELVIRSFDSADKAVPLNPLEEARAFKFLMDKLGDIEKVGDAVGRHWRYVKERLALLNLIAKAKQLVLSEKMTWLPAYVLSKHPKHVQGKALELIEKGEYFHYDHCDVKRVLSKILLCTDRKEPNGERSAIIQPTLPEPTRPEEPTATNSDWKCPKCGACYRTYCHGGKHSFERIWDDEV